MQALTSNFQVTRAHNIFRQNIHVEKLQKICRVAWNIFSTIVFPIGLVRLAINFAAKSLILPATILYDIHDRRLNRIIRAIIGIRTYPNTLIHTKNQFIVHNNAHQVKVTTADGVELDTLMVLNDKQSLDTAKQKWILFANPNANCVEELLDYYKAISDATGASVYTGNYRGVMESKGSFSSTHDLVLDVESMVQKLLSTGIREENILVHGWSLGGGAGTEVAYYHQKGEMKICNDRSFSTIIDVIIGMIGKIGKVVGKIASLAGFRFNSIEKLETIKPQNRIVIVGKADSVTPHAVSPYKLLKNKGILGGNFLKINGQKDAQGERPDFHGDSLDALAGTLEEYAILVKRILGIR